MWPLGFGYFELLRERKSSRMKMEEVLWALYSIFVVVMVLLLRLRLCDGVMMTSAWVVLVRQLFVMVTWLLAFERENIHHDPRTVYERVAFF